MGSVREMIQKRAYEIYLERGGLHGNHISDWIQAEKEITAKIEHQRKEGESKPPAALPAKPAPIAAPAKAAPASAKVTASAKKKVSRKKA